MLLGELAASATGTHPSNATSIARTPGPNRTDMKTPARSEQQLYYSDSDSLAAQVSAHTITLSIVPQRCELFGRNPHLSVRRVGERIDQVGECDDAHTSEPVLTFNLLHLSF